MVDEKYYDEIAEPLAEFYSMNFFDQVRSLYNDRTPNTYPLTWNECEHKVHEMNVDNEEDEDNINEMKPFQIDRKDLPF